MVLKKSAKFIIVFEFLYRKINRQTKNIRGKNYRKQGKTGTSDNFYTHKKRMAYKNTHHVGSIPFMVGRDMIKIDTLQYKRQPMPL